MPNTPEHRAAIKAIEDKLRAEKRQRWKKIVEHFRPVVDAYDFDRGFVVGAAEQPKPKKPSGVSCLVCGNEIGACKFPSSN